MKCEYCSNEHDGSYGSGKFCNKKCACGFSTRSKRVEINRRVSEKLKGRKISSKDGRGWKLTYEQRLEVVRLAVEAQRYKRSLISFEDSSIAEKQRRILKEQSYKCNRCGVNEWNGKSITFDLHHKNGNKADNSRDNLECLCPNCHRQTDNYCFKNKKHSSETKRKISMLHKLGHYRNGSFAQLEEAHALGA